ncbi:O-antigen ligase family protein [Leeuwenhoekiella sp. H156]|uniref:O-antigen ligase family protein n=1 Tax=Leeuwenhoekiella sp. H156 TaxID=3450128 RepID=UPI003FA4C493
MEGLKHAEKRLSLVLFPICLLSQTHRFNVQRVLRYYAWLTTIILLFCLFRFAWIEPELFTKYLNGDDLWEMGYAFARSTGNHAPALNMHVAFTVVINFYFFINRTRDSGISSLLLRLFFLIISIILLFYINTRLAIASAFFGIVLISIYQNRKAFSLQIMKKLALGLILFAVLGLGFVKLFPYSIQKFSSVTFAHMDKVGKIDELENPEAMVFNGLVTRLSIWQSAFEVAKQHPWIGVGAADGKQELNRYYKNSDQQFLAKYDFPAHNQYLDFWIKFGILGLLICLIYIGAFAWIGLKTQQVLCIFFFVLFASANLVDDFLIRFDGITFSGFWLSFFAQAYLFDRESRERTSASL